MGEQLQISRLDGGVREKLSNASTTGAGDMPHHINGTLHRIGNVWRINLKRQQIFVFGFID